MSQDPFRERETKKTNSIPSREFILQYLIKRKIPANRKELTAELNIKSKKQTEGLYRRLRAMERDGQLVFTHRQQYVLPNQLDLLKGTVIGHRDGYGFLRVEGRKEHLYISSEQMKTCIHGDLVLAQPLDINRKRRREVHILRVLVPNITQIVGRYFTNKNGGFVVPDDSRLSFNILISPEAVMNAQMGFIVVVELTQRQTNYTKASGKIVEVLGNHMGISMAINIALRTHAIPYIWPKLVEKEIKYIEEEVSETAKTGRIDLRNLPLITIDNEDARDFDDAVYCEKKPSGWCLWVAVADVSYYVRPHTSIDSEARNRGTSVYFPSQVIPMLPEILSNGLCSLNPKVDRLCIVCEMSISPKGRIASYKFYEAVMSSHARLTYTEVWNMLQGDWNLRKQYAPIVKHIEELHKLYKVLQQAREDRGSISFNHEEAKFIFNDEYRIERIEQIERNDAHKLIEECMILANTSAARFIEKAKEPTLFRIHDKPTNEAITLFRSVLTELGLELQGGHQPKPSDYSELLESITDRHNAEVLQIMLMRLMKQAIYDPENRGHFGLALQSYAHFTSPIRRYPDLLLHRTIKYLLTYKYGVKDNTIETGSYHYSMEEMLQLGQHCSMTEQRADDATREVVDWLKCDFMLDQIGNIFIGVIVNITAFGFFVRLNKLFIDGLVHISNLANNCYRFDPINQRLVSRSHGQTYCLGDQVKVRVEAVNIDERKIDFSILSNERRFPSLEKSAFNNLKKNRNKNTNNFLWKKQANLQSEDSLFYKESNLKAKLKKKVRKSFPKSKRST